jgi:hypothetical protein
MKQSIIQQRTVACVRRLAAAALASMAFCSAHAQDVSDQAFHAAIADGVSTAAGIAAGAAELNPLGPVLAIGMKAAVFQYAKTLPDVEQPAVYAAAASIWGGAAASNVCVTAAVLTGGSFAPACIALGLAWGVKTWRDSENERLFWEGCAMLRQYANEPDLKCIYTPPVQAAERPALQTADAAAAASTLQAP